MLFNFLNMWRHEVQPVERQTWNVRRPGFESRRKKPDGGLGPHRLFIAPNNLTPTLKLKASVALMRQRNLKY